MDKEMFYIILIVVGIPLTMIWLMFFAPFPYMAAKYDIWGYTIDNKSVYCWCYAKEEFNCTGGVMIGSEINCSKYNAKTLSEVMSHDLEPYGALLKTK